MRCDAMYGVGGCVLRHLSNMGHAIIAEVDAEDGRGLRTRTHASKSARIGKV